MWENEFLPSLWERVLEQVRCRNRFAWMLLAPNARLVALGWHEAHVEFSSPAARDTFCNGRADAVLVSALEDVLEGRWRLRAVVAEAGDR
ncbi:hypothetical protein [Streptomyces albus]|uniref:hypothetical protein n=1 Tax=Streptomyces albus TaxID=1888 RepID=UPI0033CE25B3